MAKKKISKKSSRALPAGAKGVRVKSLKGVKTFVPAEWVLNPDNVKEAIIDCLHDGDWDSLREVIQGYYEAMEYRRAVDKSKLSRRTYHQALSKDGNPTAKTLLKLISGVLRTS